MSLMCYDDPIQCKEVPMKHIRSLLILILALCLLTACAVAEEGAPGYDFGDKVADFTLVSTDGETLTLSSLLAEKKAVMLNFWATWCSPCRIEFPYMEQAWQEYQDDIAIIAVSTTDSASDIAAFREEMGITFPMAADTAGLAELFVDTSIPTTVMIDRNGVYCYYEVGSMPNLYSFRTLFDAFTADDYTEPLLGYVIPDPTPDQPMPASNALATALGSEGIVYSGQEGAWPWLITEDGVISGNAGMQGTSAVLHMDFTAEAGDVLVFDYRVSAEAGADYLLLAQHDQVQKTFTVDQGWQRYAWKIPTGGAQRVSFYFNKASMLAAGEDAAMLRSVALLTGEEAAIALAGNPAFPVALNGDAAELSVTTEGAKEIIVDDPNGLMTYMIGAPVRYYIVPGSQVHLQVQVGPEVDPDAAFVYYSQSQQMFFLSGAAQQDDGYAFTGSVNSLATTGSPITTYFLYPKYQDYSESVTGVMIFANEEDANYFLKDYIAYATGGAVSGLAWSYAEPGEAAYRLFFADETGTPLPGVIANVCDADMCMPMVADADGVVSFTMTGKAYDIHVIAAPEGVAFDPNHGYKTSTDGGDMTITLTRK